MKRPLPLRSTTKSSTPVIRVYAVDSPQHITEFGSASDHVLTLEKWRELHLSLSTGDTDIGHTRSLASGTGAFESEQDGGRRWKFAGPWLAGQTEGEFERYVARQVQGRMREFKEYLREDLKAEKKQERRRIAQSEGQAVDDQSVFEVTDQEVDAKLKSLRQDASLSELSAKIRSFLDLPVARGGGGPPMMHPSGGLSYLRTHAVLSNHPLLGPQAKLAPVQARVLMPRQSSTGQGSTAKLGVAGVVTDDTAGLSSFNVPEERSPLKTWDTTSPGGGKTWVHPTKASIDARGQIDLRLEYALPATIEIYTGKRAKAEESKAGKPSSRPASQSRSQAEIRSSFSSTSKGGYGIENTQERRKRESLLSKDVELEALYESLIELSSRT